MSIVITTTISIGVIIFAFITPMIVTQYEPDKLKENYYYARLALAVAMITVGTMELATIILSRHITVPTRIPWLCPRHCKDLETSHSIMKPLGIALFCVIGVYGTDVLFVIVQIACVTCQIPIIDLLFHISRSYFSTMSALFCFSFREQRFVGNLLTLFTLSLACVTAVLLWFDIALDERHHPVHPNTTARDEVPCFYIDSMPDWSSSPDSQFGTADFTVMIAARPYLYPLIAELMILFGESCAAWFFGCLLLDSHPGQSLNETTGLSSGLYSSSNGSGYKKMMNIQTLGNSSDASEESPLLRSDSRRSCDTVSELHQSNEHRLEKSWSMSQYSMTLTSGLLSALFVIFGIFFYYQPVDISPDFSILFAAYRVFFWSVFTLLTLVAYLAIKCTPAIQWVDSQVTSFEYFIIVCHVGTTLYSTFGITATLISNKEIPNIELHLVEKIFNMAQYCSQVVFYFWARGVRRPSEELLDTSKRVSVPFLLLQGVIVSLAVLNLTMWIEDSFVELAHTESESLETEFFIRWQAIYNVLNPINLLFRFNSALLFYELHHRLSIISLSTLLTISANNSAANSLTTSYAAFNQAEVSSAPSLPQSSSSMWQEGVQRRATAERRATSVGLRVVDVCGDGTCMFRAVCVSNSGCDRDHLTLRAAVVDYMRDNPAEFTQFADQSLDEHLPFTDYLIKIAQSNQAVGELVLRAICNVLNKQINVYYGDLPPRSYVPKGKTNAAGHSLCQCSAHTPCQCINILYYDMKLANNGHYMALVRLAAPLVPS